MRGLKLAPRVCLLVGTLLLFGSDLTAQTQVAASCVNASPAVAVNNVQQSPSLETVPRVPGIANVFRGFNAGINYAGVHNSSIGWYSVVTPALSYAFSEHYSADVSSSIYLKRRYLTYVPGTPPTPNWIEEAADGGDTLFAFHAAFEPGPIEEIATAALSAPTGDVDAGLGTGRVTFDFTNHAEYYRKPFGGFLDVGAGNSSGLFNNILERNFNTVGGLAHFLAGAENWIGNRFFVESLMYEQLPFGTQTELAAPLEQQQPSQHSPGSSGQASVNEDNGITTYLGIPVTTNLTLSGYYSRSLRHHADTVSFGFTWVLRGRKWDSQVDRALQEAEKPTAEN